MAAGLALSVLPIGTSTAGAKANPVICPAGDSGKVDVVGEHKTVTVSAPEDNLITGYCVKAGQLTEFVQVEPAETVTISASNGKGVSHYSFTYEPGQPPTS